MKTVTKRAAALSMLLTLAVIAAFAWSTLGASAAGSSVTINLKSVTGSKVVGTGVITDNGDGTIKVVMTMQGLEPGDHIDHIHTGSCAAQGAVVYPLTNLTADASGNTQPTSTTVKVAFSEVTKGTYYLNVHDLAKAGTSCGDITAPVANAPAAPTTAAATNPGNAPSAAPATGQGGAANSNSDFPFGLGLIAVLSLLVVGSGAALVRGRKSR